MTPEIYVEIRDKLASAATTPEMEEVARLLDSPAADVIPPAKYETLLWEFNRKHLVVTGAIEP